MTKNCTFAIITKKLCFIQSKPANYRHLLNTDTSLLWKVCFLPEERKPDSFSIFNPLKGQTNQKIEIFSFVTLPSPNTKKKHPKWDLGKDLSSQAFIER